MEANEKSLMEACKAAPGKVRWVLANLSPPPSTKVVSKAAELMGMTLRNTGRWDPDARLDAAKALSEAGADLSLMIPDLCRHKGADGDGTPEIVKEFGRTLNQKELNDCLMSSALYGNNDVVKALIESGACPSMPHETTLGNTWPLHGALNNNNGFTALVLLKADPSVASERRYDKDPEGGETPLHLAARISDFLMVSELLKIGANPLVRDNSGKLASEYALLGLKEILVKAEAQAEADALSGDCKTGVTKTQKRL